MVFMTHSRITREEARDMAQAHAEGYHTAPDGLPREGCPECEDRPLQSYPPAEPTR
jgi:hypothetical protein